MRAASCRASFEFRRHFPLITDHAKAGVMGF
jgi:hypothetical protein